MKKLSLLEVLEGIEDSRRERSVWYPLHEVLFIFLATVICRATSDVKVDMFGKSKEKWLKKYIKLENGMPDACTFRNVVKAIGTRQLHTVFSEWMKDAVESISGVVAVDGKRAQRTKNAKKRAFHTAGLPAACCAGSHRQGHGRFESRSCYICEDISWLEGREKWSNLQGIGVIFSETEENGKKSKQAHYFIYSCKGMTAAQILEAKRSHWGIENKLHWVLDMQFREDESRARADNSAENLNVLRHWAYNLLKAQSSLKGSFSDKQFKCLLDEAFLDEVIASALCS